MSGGETVHCPRLFQPPATPLTLIWSYCAMCFHTWSYCALHTHSMIGLQRVSTSVLATLYVQVRISLGWNLMLMLLYACIGVYYLCTQYMYMQYTFILSCAFIMACTTTSSVEHVAFRCLSQRGWTLFSRRQVKAVDTLPEALTTLVRSFSYHHTEPIPSLRFDVNHQLHLVWFLLYSIPTLPHSASQSCYVCVSVCDQVSLGAFCVAWFLLPCYAHPEFCPSSDINR